MLRVYLWIKQKLMPKPDKKEQLIQLIKINKKHFESFQEYLQGLNDEYFQFIEYDFETITFKIGPERFQLSFELNAAELILLYETAHVTKSKTIKGFLDLRTIPELNAFCGLDEIVSFNEEKMLEEPAILGGPNVVSYRVIHNFSSLYLEVVAKTFNLL